MSQMKNKCIAEGTSMVILPIFATYHKHMEPLATYIYEIISLTRVTCYLSTRMDGLVSVVTDSYQHVLTHINAEKY